MVQMAFCDLPHIFPKQVTNVSQYVFVILLWGILTLSWKRQADQVAARLLQVNAKQANPWLLYISPSSEWPVDSQLVAHLRMQSTGTSGWTAMVYLSSLGTIWILVTYGSGWKIGYAEPNYQ